MEKLQIEIEKKQEEIKRAEVEVFRLKSELIKLYEDRDNLLTEIGHETADTSQPDH